MIEDFMIIGKFDISKYNKKIKTTTNDVILTKEQLEHIIEKHPEVVKDFKKIKFILKDPDIILKENNKKDTIWLIKEFENNIKITIKLNTVKYGIKHYKNSIIQMQYLNNNRIINYLNSNRVTKIFEKELFM